MARRLADAGCIFATAEAGALVAAAADTDALDIAVRRRELGEPLAWITGSAIFCGRRIAVDRGVFVPRHQSEGLARRAAGLLPADGSALDVCTGTGAIAAHLIDHAPRATVVATDIDIRAVRCARRNGVPAVVSDLAAGLRCRTFDVITAVAPYVPTNELGFLPHDVQRHEPTIALDGGPDGLDIVRQLARAACEALRPGGWLLTEIGGGQAKAVEATLRFAGFEAVTPWSDDDDDVRGVVARLGAATSEPDRR
ncbi:MAG: HemK/PrmC family methyltransferase [Ilumatobacter sp.]